MSPKLAEKNSTASSSDEYRRAFEETLLRVRLDKKPNCVKGKPCKDVCIPKNAKCKDELTLKSDITSDRGYHSRLARYGLVGGGAAVAAIVAGAGAQIAYDVKKIEAKPSDEEDNVDYDSFEPGDLIRKRTSMAGASVYHYAVYAGKDPETGEHQIIHTQAPDKSYQNSAAVIVKTSIYKKGSESASGSPSFNQDPNNPDIETNYMKVPASEMYKKEGAKKLTREEILERANRAIGTDYTFETFSSNCETFARGMVEGTSYSTQGDAVSPFTRGLGDAVSHLVAAYNKKDYLANKNRRTSAEIVEYFNSQRNNARRDAVVIDNKGLDYINALEFRTPRQSASNELDAYCDRVGIKRPEVYSSMVNELTQPLGTIQKAAQIKMYSDYSKVFFGSLISDRILGDESTKADAYWDGFNSIKLDKKPNCTKGKPCKDVCIPKSAKCKDDETESVASAQSEIQRNQAFGAAAIAGAVVIGGAALAINSFNAAEKQKLQEVVKNTKIEGYKIETDREKNIALLRESQQVLDAFVQMEIEKTVRLKGYQSPYKIDKLATQSNLLKLTIAKHEKGELKGELIVYKDADGNLAATQTVAPFSVGTDKGVYLDDFNVFSSDRSLAKQVLANTKRISHDMGYEGRIIGVPIETAKPLYKRYGGKPVENVNIDLGIFKLKVPIEDYKKYTHTIGLKDQSSSFWMFEDKKKGDSYWAWEESLETRSDSVLTAMEVVRYKPLIQQLKVILEKSYTDGIDKFVKIDISDQAKIDGLFRDGRKLVKFTLDGNNLEYKIVSGVRGDSYYEGLVETLARFDKKPSCKRGKPCGDVCIPRNSECTVDEYIKQSKSNADQQKAAGETARKRGMLLAAGLAVAGTAAMYAATIAKAEKDLGKIRELFDDKEKEMNDRIDQKAAEAAAQIRKEEKKLIGRAIAMSSPGGEAPEDYLNKLKKEVFKEKDFAVPEDPKTGLSVALHHINELQTEESDKEGKKVDQDYSHHMAIDFYYDVAKKSTKDKELSEMLEARRKMKAEAVLTEKLKAYANMSVDKKAAGMSGKQQMQLYEDILVLSKHYKTNKLVKFNQDLDDVVDTVKSRYKEFVFDRELSKEKGKLKNTWWNDGKKDSYWEGFNSVRADKKANCKRGKSCGDVCIPKNSECQEGRSGSSKAEWDKEFESTSDRPSKPQDSNEARKRSVRDLLITGFGAALLIGARVLIHETVAAGVNAAKRHFGDARSEQGAEQDAIAQKGIQAFDNVRSRTEQDFRTSKAEDDAEYLEARQQLDAFNARMKKEKDAIAKKYADLREAETELSQHDSVNQIEKTNVENRWNKIQDLAKERETAETYYNAAKSSADKFKQTKNLQDYNEFVDRWKEFHGSIKRYITKKNPRAENKTDSYWEGFNSIRFDKKPKCQKGVPCGDVCISPTKSCRINLSKVVPQKQLFSLRQTAMRIKQQEAQASHPKETAQPTQPTAPAPKTQSDYVINPENGQEYTIRDLKKKAQEQGVYRYSEMTKDQLREALKASETGDPDQANRIARTLDPERRSLTGRAARAGITGKNAAEKNFVGAIKTWQNIRKLMDFAGNAPGGWGVAAVGAFVMGAGVRQYNQLKDKYREGINDSARTAEARAVTMPVENVKKDNITFVVGGFKSRGEQADRLRELLESDAELAQKNHYIPFDNKEFDISETSLSKKNPDGSYSLAYMGDYAAQGFGQYVKNMQRGRNEDAVELAAQLYAHANKRNENGKLGHKDKNINILAHGVGGQTVNEALEILARMKSTGNGTASGKDILDRINVVTLGSPDFGFTENVTGNYRNVTSQQDPFSVLPKRREKWVSTVPGHEPEDYLNNPEVKEQIRQGFGYYSNTARSRETASKRRANRTKPEIPRVNPRDPKDPRNSPAWGDNPEQDTQALDRYLRERQQQENLTRRQKAINEEVQKGRRRKARQQGNQQNG